MSFQTGVTDFLPWKTKEEFINIASCSLKLQRTEDYNLLKDLKASWMWFTYISCISELNLRIRLVLWTASVLKRSTQKNDLFMNQTFNLLYFYGGLASFLILENFKKTPHSLKQHGKEQGGHPSFFFYRKWCRTCLEKHEY